MNPDGTSPIVGIDGMVDKMRIGLITADIHIRSLQEEVKILRGDLKHVLAHKTCGCEVCKNNMIKYWNPENKK